MSSHIPGNTWTTQQAHGKQLGDDEMHIRYTPADVGGYPGTLYIVKIIAFILPPLDNHGAQWSQRFYRGP